MTFADLSPLANHLWQSTLCVAVAWLLTLALRKNRAAVRFWIWFAASAKFLLPFSLFVSAGRHLAWRAAPAIAPSQFSTAMETLSQPFAVPAATPLAPVVAPALNPVPAILVGVWLCGIAVGLVFWVRWWRQTRRLLRASTQLNLGLPIRVMSTASRFEPGIVGIFRPVLLLPAGIAEHLTPAQFEAIIAHELRHAERRDNLTAEIHMLVETIFWFHPLVWWIKWRLIEERERACDEGVLGTGSEPRVYAESILKVCEFYLAAPAPCVAGVTGGELKKRIEGIMENRFGLGLGFGRRALIAAVALGSLTLPLALGVFHAGAQTEAAALPRFEVASVKPLGPNDHGGSELKVYPGGRVVIPGFTLESLVATAFHISGRQIAVREEWIEKDLYYIEARPSAEAQRSIRNLKHTWFDIEDERLRQMLQALLIDRFHLQYHRETKTGDVYLLERSGKTLRLSPSAVAQAPSTEADPAKGDATPFGGFGHGDAGYAGGQWGLYNMTMAQFAKFASDYYLRAPVLDQTGLSGPFNYRQAVPDDEPTYAGPEHDASFMRMISAVGLKLERSKGPIETFVIDKAEKPSPN